MSMTEKEAIKALKRSEVIIRYETNGTEKNSQVTALHMAVESLQKQEKLKERITELTKERKEWEEMFVGEVVKLLKEFVLEGE